MRNVADDSHPKDVGCHVWPKCLTCPLERCIFDAPTGEASRQIVQYETLREAHARLGTAKAVAREYGIAERTVWRALARK